MYTQFCWGGGGMESVEGMSAVNCLTDIIWIVSLLLALTLDRILYLKVDTCVKCISQKIEK